MIEKLFDGIETFLRFTMQDLPAEKRQIDALLLIVQLIKTEPEHAVQLVLPGHDDPGELYLGWRGDGYKMVLSFPMEDFDWPNPLLLCGEGLACKDVEEIVRGICLEGRETDSFPVIMKRFRNITTEVFGEFSPDDSRDEENRAYAEALDGMLRSYAEAPNPETHIRILCHVFEGIAHDNKLPAPIDVDPDAHYIGPLFVEFEDGTEALALMTAEDEIPTMGFRFSSLIRECEQNGKCGGILFNYGKDNSFYLPRAVLQAAIQAGRQIAAEENERGKQDV